MTSVSWKVRSIGSLGRFQRRHRAGAPRSGLHRLGGRTWPYDTEIPLQPEAWPAHRTVTAMLEGMTGGPSTETFLIPVASTSGPRPGWQHQVLRDTSGRVALVVRVGVRDGVETPGWWLTNHPNWRVRIHAEIGPATDRAMRSLMSEIAPGQELPEAYIRPVSLHLVQQRADQPRID